MIIVGLASLIEGFLLLLLLTGMLCMRGSFSPGEILPSGSRQENTGIGVTENVHPPAPLN